MTWVMALACTTASCMTGTDEFFFFWNNRAWVTEQRENEYFLHKWSRVGLVYIFYQSNVGQCRFVNGILFMCGVSFNFFLLLLTYWSYMWGRFVNGILIGWDGDVKWAGRYFFSLQKINSPRLQSRLDQVQDRVWNDSEYVIITYRENNVLLNIRFVWG